jgi:predicted adenine nucleotide alpha hydrolase (AANH) superfamily ATPase
MPVTEHLLVHTCCAPCLIAPHRQLKEEGIRHGVFWFNPNIHPYTEYKARLDTLKAFAEKEGLPLLLADGYGLDEFVKNTIGDLANRCEYCYRTRLEATAKTAAEQGFSAFTTTLLYSKYQKHELIRQVAEEMSAKYGIPFFYRDWRSLWQEGIELSKREQMYRQKYCGCIFSEEERYLRKRR